jgi:hypothetical protein
MALLQTLEVLPGHAGTISARLRHLDVHTLVEQARLHGLSAYVERELDAAGIRLSDPDDVCLRKDATNVVGGSLRVKTLLLRVLKALTRANVTPVLLKGPCLSARLYGDALVRGTSDVDLLVESHQVRAVTDVLAAIGLELQHTSEAYYPPRYRHHVCYADHTGIVEVHFRAMSAFGALVEADRWLERTTACTFEGHRVRILETVDELVYLSLHAANHLFQRIAWLFDLKLFVARYPTLSWGALVREARASRLPCQVFFALNLARTLLKAPIPTAVLEALAPTAVRRAVGQWAFADRKLAASSLHLDKRAWLLAKLLLADSRTTMALFVLRRAAWNVEKRLAFLR